jgi:hypothetical protein
LTSDVFWSPPRATRVVVLVAARIVVVVVVVFVVRDDHRLVIIVVVAAASQGLTLVHFSAQLERFFWDRGCAYVLCNPC